MKGQFLNFIHHLRLELFNRIGYKALGLSDLSKEKFEKNLEIVKFQANGKIVFLVTRRLVGYIEI
jgi:hypothetical protein